MLYSSVPFLEFDQSPIPSGFIVNSCQLIRFDDCDLFDFDFGIGPHHSYLVTHLVGR